MSELNICIWNVNYVNQHKLEIIRFLSEKNIDVMLLSETHLTNKNNFFILVFRLCVKNPPDGKAHGGTAVLVRNQSSTTISLKKSRQWLNSTRLFILIIYIGIYNPISNSISFRWYKQPLGEQNYYTLQQQVARV